MSEDSRQSLRIRLQAKKGTPLDEVRQWLDSLTPLEKNQKIAEVLVMCLLTYARLDSGKSSREELLKTCLLSIDTADKHFSTIKQILNLTSENYSARKNEELNSVLANNGLNNHLNQSLKTSQVKETLKQKLGQVNIEEVDQMFD